ncbi:neuropeptide Y receptor [Tyrophagus putrescentiae]|nr:neuropeptide Y receptor [Tyrophagus putrescentiae]
MEFLKQMSSSSSSSSSELGSPIHHHHQHYGHHLHRHRPPLYSLSSMSAAASAPYSSAPIISSVSPSPSSSSSLNPSNLQYLMQEGLHQLANFSSATLQEMALSVGDNGNNENNGGVGGEPMSLPQSLQHRQYQLPPEQHTGELTTIMSMVMANGSISNPQQTSTPQYDESVFSLLTFRNALIITCYSLIILVSLTGNLLVCRVAFGTREMRTTTNLLIASLACSDIVMTGE